MKLGIYTILLLTCYQSYSQKWEPDSFDVIQLGNKEEGHSFVNLLEFNGDKTLNIVSILDSVDLISYKNGKVETSRFLFKQNLESSGSMATDVNADGIMDLVIGSYWSNRFSIYLGVGDTLFSEPVHYGLDGHCNGIDVGFINDDEYPDIVAIRNGSTKPIAVHVFLNRGDGTFEKSYFHNTEDHTNSELHITDLNNDKKNDILIRSVNGFVLTYIQIQPNDFEFNYIPIMPFFPDLPFTIPGGLGVANDDFSNDGFDDLLISYPDSLIIRKGKGDGTFEAQSVFQFNEISLINILVTDLNVDDTLDIIGTKYNKQDGSLTDSLFIFKYDPLGDSIIKTHEIKLPEKPRFVHNSIIAHDFTGDGIIDLAIQSEGNKLIIVKGKEKDAIVGLPDKDKNRFIIYPNPSNGRIFFNTELILNKSLEVSIYTLSGQLVSNKWFPKIKDTQLAIELNTSEKILLLRGVSNDMVFRETIYLE